MNQGFAFAGFLVLDQNLDFQEPPLVIAHQGQRGRKLIFHDESDLTVFDFEVPHLEWQFGGDQAMFNNLQNKC